MEVYLQLLVLDVDGVLTTGDIVYSDAAAELKGFHVRDGSGLKIWQFVGRRSAVITGRCSRVVERRAQEVGIERNLAPRRAARLDQDRGNIGL